MMYQVSTLTYDHLMAYDVAGGNPFSGFIYPLLAPIETPVPFCVYKVDKTTEFSKENIHDVNVTIIVVGNDYKKLCSISDGIEDYFEALSETWDYVSTTSGFNPDDTSELNITIKYNLKMLK